MTTTSRLLDGPDDVMAVHRFIADNYDRTPRGCGWEIRRWEGQWWHRSPEELAEMLTGPRDDIRLWEVDGDLVAVAHPEGRGYAHMQIHPDHEGLTDEMLTWAEQMLAADGDHGRRLTAFAPTDAQSRIALLQDRGYVRQDWGETQRWSDLADPPDSPQTPGEYQVRSLRPGDRDDADALADLINAAFGHSFGAEDLLNFEHAPSYDDQLMIVAEAPDGSLAAHAGVIVDTRNQLAIVEPVCTHPEHRRRSLASVCIAEGLARARARGANRATIGAGLGAPSNIVYERLGFTEFVDVPAWTKQLD